MFDMIPDVLIEEILFRLPVETLVLLGCVSKSWRALITSHDFISKHLTYSQHKNANRRLMRIQGANLHSADMDSLDQTNSANIFEQLESNPPLKCPYLSNETRLVGSSNGLLCLSNSKREFVLLNPTTKRYRILHYPRIEFDSGKRLCGFGYDVANDDYKFVGIIGFEAIVYSLNLNSWRSVQTFPYRFWYWTNCINANSALHYVVLDLGRRQSIVAFDLGTEECRLVPQPEYSDHDVGITLGILGGCLCVICIYRRKSNIDVWVMKEYGVKESWNNMISIEESDFQWNCRTCWPLAYSDCGRQVLLGNSDKLFWYDLGKKSITYAAEQTPHCDLDIIQPSLVRLDGGGYKRTEITAQKL